MRFLIALLAWALLGPAVAAAQQPTGPVLTYHRALSRAGNYVVPGLTLTQAKTLHLDTTFKPSFVGNVYAQPLYWRPERAASGLLIVATESDVVYALDPLSGAQVWKRSLGTPVQSGDLPCGNISPLGVTGTPTIDAANETLYVEAMVEQSDGPHHKLFALRVSDGVARPGWPIDIATAVPGFTASTQNERGALALFDDEVFVAFSGLSGDCATYNGRVVGIPTDTTKPATNYATTARGGGIWGQGGVTGDGASLFVATGNTFTSGGVWGGGEAVLRLGTDLAAPKSASSFFAASNWLALDQGDLDLGSTAPVPLAAPSPSGTRPLIFAAGKDGYAYLLDRNSLGGFGGQLVKFQINSGENRVAPAVWPTSGGVNVVLTGSGVACPSNGGQGLIALKITANPSPAIAFAWCAALSSNDASPIVTTTDGTSNPIVWVLGAEGDNELHAFDGATGASIVSSSAMQGLHHFQTLIATSDRLYVAADNMVYAFGF